MLIRYKKITHYKYQLMEEYVHDTGILGYYGHEPEDWVSISNTGILIVRRGYCWDGCSGPTWDDETNMRGSLVHDALYQLCRLAILPESCLSDADVIFRNILIEDGMPKWRAWYYFHGVNNWYVHKVHG